MTQHADIPSGQAAVSLDVLVYDPEYGSFVTPVSCADCIGACCIKGVCMELSESEKVVIEESGTTLEEMPVSVEGSTKKHPTRRFYKLSEDCGHLILDQESGQKKCGIYESPSRPQVCQKFPVGGYSCRQMRADNEVDPYEHFVYFKRVT